MPRTSPELRNELADIWNKPYVEYGDFQCDVWNLPGGIPSTTYRLWRRTNRHNWVNRRYIKHSVEK